MPLARHATLYRAENTDPAKPVVMRCYQCGTRTLTFDDATENWHCFRCKRTLTLAEAVDEIVVYEPREPKQSNWQAIMSSVWCLGKGRG